MVQTVSPFAALTGSEKQIKWLEYQSLRLPYIQTETAVHSEKENKGEVERKCETPKATETQAVTHHYPNAAPPSDFSQVKHRQYDAVIARMKQAELQTGGFKTL